MIKGDLGPNMEKEHMAKDIHLDLVHMAQNQEGHNRDAPDHPMDGGGTYG